MFLAIYQSNMKLTPTLAHQIALDLAPQIKPEKQGEFFLIHTTNVVRVAKIIAKNLNLDEDFFEIAGRIHDIGYVKDMEHHADYSLSILTDLWYDTDPKLKDCILNHGNSKSPTTLEGRIFQIADKLSIFDASLIELFLQNEDFPITRDGLLFLKAMSEKSFKLLENLA